MPNTGITALKRIMIVDDEYSIREALCMFFSSRGFSAVQAANGTDALSKIEKEDFDLIISDIRMDKMDGITLVRKLKGQHKTIPIIFITAYPEFENAVEALRNGVVEYITKPFEMEAMGKKVDEILAMRVNSSEESFKKKYKASNVKFLARLSHELRTPLTPVAGYITLLLKKEFGELPAQQMEIIKSIARNSKRLKMLTEDLIMLYAVENAEEPMLLKKHWIARLVNEAIAEDDENIKIKHQSVDFKIFDGLEEIYCDEKKFKRVIYHVVDNAVKFSPEHSTIDMSVRKFIYDNNNYVKFSVSDAGERLKGMDKRVFFRGFYDINIGGDDGNMGNTIKGLGLGLTLSKALIEAHCGRIWVDAHDNFNEKGNTFSFIIPLI